MENIEKKCETLERNNKKLELQVVNLKSIIEKNVVEHSHIEEYKQEVEEKAS